MPEIKIRKAVIEDIDLLLDFINKLAKEEKAESEVKTSREKIQKTLFNQKATSHAVICEADGVAIGHAVYFFNYSTWQGQNGLYIEDLYILAKYRNLGAGKEIIKYLSRLALTENCGRMEWSVLNWNKAAIKFYESLGAKPQKEWIRYRLSDNALKKTAKL